MAEQKNFIEKIIDEDLASGRYNKVHTRFPPEPNGYLHIGHAKAIVLNFSIAEKYGGFCNLRMDDTNPLTERQEYVEAAIRDVRWLGYDWADRLYYASDYFERFYEFAKELIKMGLAYVDDLSPEEIRQYRGTLTEPGKESPYRNRSVEENLELFERMKNGEFEEGQKVLRAKIDMASPNLNMRDPVIYRIIKAPHYRTGDRWCIYPTYDFAHPLSDALEGITHSLCTLEFEDHRPLYDWFVDKLGPTRPRQIEFARLNITYMVLSKRKLTRLVEEGHVSGWDDPRMPTIAGLRRRGYTPEAIRDFCHRIGISKAQSLVDIELLEHCLREDLNRRAPRRMAVLRPLKLVIDNMPEGHREEVHLENNPEDPEAGTRAVPFTRELYIERDDFMEEPPPKFYRLAPGREVRLKGAYIVRCESVEKDPRTGEPLVVHCVYDPESKSGMSKKRTKATIHWVSATGCVEAEVRLYDRLFKEPNPEECEDFIECLNPYSLEVLKGCKVEPSLKGAKTGEIYQFLRLGYFCVDPDSEQGTLVFNRAVTLKDEWAKIKQKIEKGGA
jgi:glutaminyl-tRNA synthetase